MSFSALLGALNVTAVDAFGVQWTSAQLSGWAKPASTLSPIQKPRSSGAWAGAAYAAGRHLVMSGLIIAPDQDSLTDAVDRLLSAASLESFVLTVTEGSRTRTMNVRQEDEVISEYITNVIASWSVQLFAPDPRKLGAALSGSTLLPVTTGGITVPLTVPYTINSTVVAGQVTLTNPGNEEGPVTMRIDGPCTGPVITHIGSGFALVFSSSLVLNAGEFLLIDMEARTVLANGQSSRSGYITSRGWSQFDPGVNVWSFTATGYNTASMLTVTATPAWK